MSSTCVAVSMVFLLLFPASGSAGDERRMALVMKALTNPFFVNMKEGAEEYAKERGLHLEVFGVERETDIDRQIGIVEGLIARNYDALVIAPADSKRLVPVCRKAMKKGMVVINIDNPFHAETLRSHDISIPFVGSDNREGAQMVGSYIGRKIGKGGDVLIVEGIRGVENAELRKQGFLESLAQGDQIRVLASEAANWHKDEAFFLTTKLLLEFPDIDAILCANDNMALGVIEALHLTDKAGEVWIGAYDNIEEARQEMRLMHIHATIEQHPELMGRYGVRLAEEALEGKAPPAQTVTPLDLVTYESFGKRVGLSIADLDNPFFKSLERGAEKAAALHGVRLTVKDAANDDARQLVDMQKFVEDKFDAIIAVPTHAMTAASAIELAAASDIEVITVDRKSASEDNVISHVASDNVAGGRMAGQFVAEQLKGKGTVLEIEGIPGASAAWERSNGFNDALRAYGDVVVKKKLFGDFNRRKTRELVAALIDGNEKFDAIFAHNDEMALGAVEAFEAKNATPPGIVVGFDAIDEAVKAVADNRLTATVRQLPERLGRLGVLMAVESFRGETPPKETLIELEIVSK